MTDFFGEEDGIKSAALPQFHFRHLWSNPLLESDGKTPVVELNLKKERAAIESVLRRSSFNVFFRSAVATNKEIRLETLNCQIVHFSGHGKDGELAFEFDSNHTSSGNLGKPLLYTADKLTNINKKFKPQLVFVNACDSEAIGNTFVDIGVPHVIAIRRETEVLDEEAICFTEMFYECLLNRRLSIQEAFIEAKQEVEVEIMKSDKEKFLLLPSDSDIHLKTLDIVEQQPATAVADEMSKPLPNYMIDKSPKLPAKNCDTHHVRNMIGRHEVVAEAYRGIHDDDNRIVLIVGGPKIGKTQVALKLFSYSYARSEFEEYFVFKQSEVPVFPPPPVPPQSSPESRRLENTDGLCFNEQDHSFSIEEFKQRCNSKSVFLLLIGYDVNSTELRDFLDALHQNQDYKNLRIVLTCREKPSALFRALRYYVEVPPLDLDDAIELFMNTVPHVKEYSIPKKELISFLMPMQGQPSAIVDAANALEETGLSSSTSNFSINKEIEQVSDRKENQNKQLCDENPTTPAPLLAPLLAPLRLHQEQYPACPSSMMQMAVRRGESRRNLEASETRVCSGENNKDQDAALSKETVISLKKKDDNMDQIKKEDKKTSINEVVLDKVVDKMMLKLIQSESEVSEVSPRRNSGQVSTTLSATTNTGHNHGIGAAEEGLKLPSPTLQISTLKMEEAFDDMKKKMKQEERKLNKSFKSFGDDVKSLFSPASPRPKKTKDKKSKT